MNIFFMYPPRNRFEYNDFTENINRLKSIGVTTLYLIPCYFTPDPRSSTLDSTSQTIPDSQLCSAITIAQNAGLEVVLKPHIDCLNGQPRYTIDPENYDLWMLRYRTFIVKYLSIASQYGHRSFVIATELDNIVENSLFTSFCDSIRNVSPINIILSTSYNHFIKSDIWKHADIVGVNAYFNLDNSDNPRESTLRETWNYYLNTIQQFSQLNGKQVILTEAGFMSRSNAASNPGDFSGDPSVDVSLQEQCYEALLSQACKFDNIQGIFFWQWELGTSSSDVEKDYTPRGKPAESTIKRYWAQ
ncbi:MAG TPA: hypothetical protein VHO70_16150 [Chitinispirillaceae bacterium]|nr:hypothetical protein [Chitinispirillaceae bacterium]